MPNDYGISDARIVDLFRKCYELERSQTPEHLRGTYDENTGTLLEMIRLKQYPLEIVERVWDRTIGPRLEQIFPPSYKTTEYLAELEKVRKILENDPCAHEKIKRGIYEYTISRVVIDSETGKVYEFTGYGGHAQKIRILFENAAYYYCPIERDRHDIPEKPIDCLGFDGKNQPPFEKIKPRILKIRPSYLPSISRVQKYLKKSTQFIFLTQKGTLIEP